MNAQELFLKDGRSTGIYFCEKCRTVKTCKGLADECCKPKHCERCHDEVCSGYWRICDKCRLKERTEKEEETYIKAEKIGVEDCYGPVFCLDNEYYYDTIDSFLEEMEEDELDETAKVYVCNEDYFVKIDLDWIIDNICENAYEDFDYDDLKGMDELKKAIKIFEEKNKKMVSWLPNFKKAVILKPNKI